ncbi:hypothetical protein JCM10908_000630 [Rhodotorula pacifica]|uniref:uncharacterized protein n=1 Tax=Rhodotorula pacifica TaxID=1495444 RepID=UPI00317CC685
MPVPSPSSLPPSKRLLAASTVDDAFAATATTRSTPCTLSSSAALPLQPSEPSTPLPISPSSATAPSPPTTSDLTAAFEAHFYPPWLHYITYSFLALFGVFIIACYAMAWWKIRVADRKADEREAEWRRLRRQELLRQWEGEGEESGSSLEEEDGSDLSSLLSSSSMSMSSSSEAEERPSQRPPPYNHRHDAGDLEASPMRKSRTRTAKRTFSSESGSTSSRSDISDDYHGGVDAPRGWPTAARRPASSMTSEQSDSDYDGRSYPSTQEEEQGWKRADRRRRRLSLESAV